MPPTFHHVPVLLPQVLRGLALRPGGVYADFTLGLAGHALAVVATSPPRLIYAFDRDSELLNEATGRLNGGTRNVEGRRSVPGKSGRIVPGTLGSSNENVFGALDEVTLREGRCSVPGKCSLLELGVALGEGRRSVLGKLSRPAPGTLGSSNDNVPGSLDEVTCGEGSSSCHAPGTLGSSNENVSGSLDEVTCGEGRRSVPGKSGRIVPGTLGSSNENVSGSLDEVTLGAIEGRGQPNVEGQQSGAGQHNCLPGQQNVVGASTSAGLGATNRLSGSSAGRTIDADVESLKSEQMTRQNTEVNAHPANDLETRVAINDESMNASPMRVIAHHGSYADARAVIKNEKLDAALMDLGTCSFHFDNEHTGMSFMRDGPLDMRFDRSSGGSLTAKQICNQWTEHDLGALFRDSGEEAKWRECARAVVVARNEKPLETTGDLVKALDLIFNGKRGSLHPATKCFQALRLAVNDELGHLARALPDIMDLLVSPGGRLAVISFQGLEDAIVKDVFRKAKQSGFARDVSKKPIMPTLEEIQLNPRARSAKLRILERA